MRWFFLLLLVLNVFYYIWHQQEAPLRAKEVAPLAQYRGARQDIQLLSESRPAKEGVQAEQCLYLGGYSQAAKLTEVGARLNARGVATRAVELRGEAGGGHWLQVQPSSRAAMEGAVLDGLVKELVDLKQKIMPCTGIATVD
ncbi:hypothetical protein [Pseudomonas sp. nanlin1]|uniref:hypothetical protein n=1 Tax=Pseudomonas sp. nanlin1 TaxID=3040605 RepID=UPI003890CAAA